MVLRNFISNVILLAVENLLMHEIPNLFTTDMIIRMSSEELEELAAESEDVAARRKDITDELQTLKDGLALCDDWDKRSKCKCLACESG